MVARVKSIHDMTRGALVCRSRSGRHAFVPREHQTVERRRRKIVSYTTYADCAICGSVEVTVIEVPSQERIRRYVKYPDFYLLDPSSPRYTLKQYREVLWQAHVKGLSSKFRSQVVEVGDKPLLRRVQ